MASAFITGVTGQDGAYLARQLLEEGQTVIGGVRRSSALNTWRLEELGIADRITFVNFDLFDPGAIRKVLREHRPDEVYNLAAQSFVWLPFDQPHATFLADALAVVDILEAIREISPETRFYQASTSEMFGKVQEMPQTERTPFHPRSPYGVAKLAAHWQTLNHREAHGLFACSGIRFNHESPLRGPEFVTRKITIGLARLKAGEGGPLSLGNLDAKRDWGYAPDYVRGMRAMLTAESADDYVLATGETRSVREFATLAAEALGFAPEWQGEGVEERAVCTRSGQVLATIDPRLHRPAEVDILLGDPSRAAQQLGWSPDLRFEALVERMAAADMDRVNAGVPLYDRNI